LLVGEIEPPEGFIAYKIQHALLLFLGKLLNFNVYDYEDDADLNLHISLKLWLYIDSVNFEEPDSGLYDEAVIYFGKSRSGI
jgi:hypothetical protein